MKGYLVHKDGKTYRIRKDGMWDMRYKAGRKAHAIELLTSEPMVNFLQKPVFRQAPVKLAYRHSAWGLLRPFLIPILVTIILGASYQAWVRYNENPDNWVTVVRSK